MKNIFATFFDELVPLKEARKAAGLTQLQLAEKSGVNSRQIQRIESGESSLDNMTASNVLALAAALGIDPYDLQIKMKVDSAWYPRQLPTKIMLVIDGKHYAANLTPFRRIASAELQPMPTWDANPPEQFWDDRDRIPEYVLRFYGLELA